LLVIFFILLLSFSCSKNTILIVENRILEITNTQEHKYSYLEEISSYEKLENYFNNYNGSSVRDFFKDKDIDFLGHLDILTKIYEIFRK
jgi:hypothetical protein